MARPKPCIAAHIPYSPTPCRPLPALPQHLPLLRLQVKRSRRMQMPATPVARMRGFRQRSRRFSKAAAARSASRSCASWGRGAQARRRWRIHCADELSCRRTAPLVLAWSRCRSHTLTCKWRQQAAGLFCSNQTAVQASFRTTSWLGPWLGNWRGSKAATAAAGASRTLFASPSPNQVSISPTMRSRLPRHQVLQIKRPSRLHRHRYRRCHHHHLQPPQRQCSSTQTMLKIQLTH